VLLRDQSVDHEFFTGKGVLVCVIGKGYSIQDGFDDSVVDLPENDGLDDTSNCPVAQRRP
jgi:hypothetical protein